ncbi:MAG TPA: S8 family serine peptidase, partial [Symbiobacteriaceae bacterium]|nr:S8 family serine peptidase [Symbiobacteriaceae bacterium]
MRRFLKARYLALFLANVLVLAILLSHSSVATLRARPARPEGRKVDPDSIAVTAKLERYQYELVNDRTLLVTATGTGTVYLVKDDQTVLAGADVRFQLPRFGISGAMTPGEPGAYNYRISEQIRITSPLPLLDTRGWQVRDLRIESGGQDRTGRLALDETTASAFNFTRKDVSAAGLGVFRSPRAYSITSDSRLTFRVLKADGKPAANLTATIELPQRNYRETFSTDANGWVHIDRVDELQLTVQGGDLVTINGPVVIYPPSDPDTLFWWEDPTPRCDMDLRALDRRLAVKPGETARFGFEVINLGNRPDDYTIGVEGVPESWVEVEYGGVVNILPFFGQTVYVNVTPERSPDTKMGNRRITFTATAACGGEKNAVADVKVQEFRAAEVDIVGSDVLPDRKVDPALAHEARQAGDEGMVTAILRSGAPLPDGARQEVENLGGLVRQQFGVINGMAVQIPVSKLDQLAQLGWVARLDQNKVYRATLDRSVPAMGAPALWNLGYTGAGVNVAVLDTGVDYTHPALAGHVVKGPDLINNDNDPMDGHGHGTHVAGIIASQDQRRRGVAPGATIIAVKVLSDEGYGSDEQIIAGIDWAVMHGADVINLSLGGPGGGGADALAQAVDNAVKSGVVVVVAAGNSGPDFSTVGSPGDARLALTVGASDNDRQLQSWSSRGPTLDGRQKPDVVAPGSGIVSLAPGGEWQPMDGTSMATPHVSGLAALLLQATGAEPLLIKDALKRTAQDLGNGPNQSGAGFVRPQAALE